MRSELSCKISRMYRTAQVEASCTASQCQDRMRLLLPTPCLRSLGWIWAEWAASVPANALKAYRLLERVSGPFCGSTYDMASAAERLDEPALLSLPEDLLNDIGSRLNEKDVCNLELANAGVHDVLLRPTRTVACKRRLDLEEFDCLFGPHSGRRQEAHRSFLCNYKRPVDAQCVTSAGHTLPTASQRMHMPLKSYLMPRRWLRERIMRYNHISCPFCDTMLPADGALDEGDALPPMLPSLLEACGPSAGLSLSVPPQMGKPAVANKKNCCLPCAGLGQPPYPSTVQLSLRICMYIIPIGPMHMMRFCCSRVALCMTLCSRRKMQLQMIFLRQSDPQVRSFVQWPQVASPLVLALRSPSSAQI